MHSHVVDVQSHTYINKSINVHIHIPIRNYARGSNRKMKKESENKTTIAVNKKKS